MLFNSYAFICLFLPITLLGYFQLARFDRTWSAVWLMLASLFFYGYWNLAYVWLLLFSISCNYAFGVWIAKAAVLEKASQKKYLLIGAIVLNLLVLAYYKYANFFIGSALGMAGLNWNIGTVILPLGISFFTFTQIAFLVDAYQGKAKEYRFIHYALFVTYFPHLIAGPVLHHKEMMPQFSQARTYRFNYENLSVGITIFVIGLFKKVILADGVSGYGNEVFSASSAGLQLTLIEAWAGVLCYALQLYFDFSGYSDMAIGLSRMFGVKLPLNFNSPYKSVNVIEFWRNWHMTLSRFLRDYLYIPLGGNRGGTNRRHLNLLLTMLLGGLWHGAGWTFILWGGLHGIFLVINHAWQHVRKVFSHSSLRPLSLPMHGLSVVITFLAVVVAWVLFRAENLKSALAMYKAMFGLNGLTFPDTWLSAAGTLGLWLSSLGIAFGPGNELISSGQIIWICVSLVIVWFLPNTQQLMAAYEPALDFSRSRAVGTSLEWRPNAYWLSVILLAFLSSLSVLAGESPFLYFQF